MTWCYAVKTGHWFHKGVHVYTGYSGKRSGRNNPEMETVPDVGPIPRGKYHFGSPHDSDHMGPYAVALIPDGHDARGRSGFYLHGNNVEHDASEGCIILSPRSNRESIVATGEALLVIAEDDDAIA